MFIKMRLSQPIRLLTTNCRSGSFFSFDQSRISSRLLTLDYIPYDLLKKNLSTNNNDSQPPMGQRSKQVSIVGNNLYDFWLKKWFVNEDLYLCESTNANIDNIVTKDEMWDVVDGTNLAERIEEHFNTCMKNDKVPLLVDFSTFSKSLPVKHYRYDYFKTSVEFTPLFKMGYYVESEDLAEMAAVILDRGTNREGVKYISYPTKSGKTASVLPAFLRSASMKRGGSHYFYMAFDNNNKRNFKYKSRVPSSNELIAERQGAAFILECVKTLFEHPDNIESYDIEIEGLPMLTVGACSEILSKYLNEKLGENLEIFFHLDEHANMCSREVGDGAAFSRGAMKALACADSVIVIATYVEKPPLPAEGYSGVCRVPIALPSIDVNQIMSVVPELSIDSSKFDSEQRRLLACLKLRLGFKLKEMDLISLLYHRRSKESTEEFLRTFAKSKEEIQTNATTALLRLNGDFTFDFLVDDTQIPDAAATRLLLSMEDSEIPVNRQFTDLVSLPNKRVGTSVPRLLKIFDPANQVYDVGRDLFCNQLTKSPDLLSGTPLETAYFWSLASEAALNHKLKFASSYGYSINCKKLIPGRLFQGTDSSVYNLDFLRHGTIYYADERVGGKPTHPLADMFFITDEDELVLVDIFGGMKELKFKDKENSLAAWIKAEQSKIPQYTLRGVVLAPNVNITSNNIDHVLTVTGKDAIKCLGALKQILRWLE